MSSAGPIRIIITGGTFDKAYDSLRGELTLSRTHLPDILQMVHCTVDTRPEVRLLKDSLDMDDRDRQVIADACRECAEEIVIVTHGTDTMSKTAAVVAAARLEKTIVFTGAMVPYAVNGSDALFNLGGAFAAAQSCPPGVYIVMNGRVFESGSVRKNRTNGIFEEVNSDREKADAR